MYFTNPQYYLFLLVVLILFRILPWSLGRFVLLGASYFFYAYLSPWYLLLLLGSTLLDFWVGIALFAAPQNRKKLYLYISLILNLGLMGLFKYSGLINDIIALLTPNDGSFNTLSLLLPIGLSFYTFQTLSYTIDIYKKRIEPTRDFVQYALYVSFFPKLLSGPIERASAFLPQLEKKNKVEQEDIVLGIQRILWGLLKKLVLADNLAIAVDTIFLDPSQYGATTVFLGIFGFAFQLYLDFSAYTDIALGSARLFGIKLSENFYWPFISTNPSEYWSKWHMSLTNWFTQYVFRPMGGMMRKNLLRTGFNVVVTMLLTGLWHGATWNFLFFGLAAGLNSAIYTVIKLHPSMRGKELFGKAVWSKPAANFVNIFWMTLLFGAFFRAPDLATALKIFHSLTDFTTPFDPQFINQLTLLFFVVTFHTVRGTRNQPHEPLQLKLPLRILFWIGLAGIIYVAGVNKESPFLYFSF